MQWTNFFTNFSPKKWGGVEDASPCRKKWGRPTRPRPTTPLVLTDSAFVGHSRRQTDTYTKQAKTICGFPPLVGSAVQKPYLSLR